MKQILPPFRVDSSHGCRQVQRSRDIERGHAVAACRNVRCSAPARPLEAMTRASIRRCGKVATMVCTLSTFSEQFRTCHLWQRSRCMRSGTVDRRSNVPEIASARPGLAEQCPSDPPPEPSSLVPRSLVLRVSCRKNLVRWRSHCALSTDGRRGCRASRWVWKLPGGV